MVKSSVDKAIQQKITELETQITHFEQCIRTAKEHIATLQQALIAKVFKRYPAQWLSTTEIVHKVFEIEEKGILIRQMFILLQ